MVLDEHPFLDDQEEEEKEEEGPRDFGEKTGGGSISSSSNSSINKEKQSRQRPRRPLHISLVEDEEEGYRIAVSPEGGREGGREAEEGRTRGVGRDG